jgi:hypothetical protein
MVIVFGMKAPRGQSMPGNLIEEVHYLRFISGPCRNHDLIIDSRSHPIRARLMRQYRCQVQLLPEMLSLQVIAISWTGRVTGKIQRQPTRSRDARKTRYIPSLSAAHRITETMQ